MTKEGSGSLYWSIAVLLEPAAKAGKCFVCAVQKRDFDRHLFWFLEENYNSGPTINKLLASQGLCVHHMQVLRDRRVRWQISFFGELLMDYNRHLAEKAMKRARSARNAGLTGILRPAPHLGDVFAPKMECPFCSLLRESERFVLTALANGGNEPEFESIWRNVCLPHGLMLAPLLPAEVASSVANSLRRRLNGVAALPDAAAFFLGALPRTTRAAFLPSIAAELLADQRVSFKAALMTDTEASALDEVEWKDCPLCDALQNDDGAVPEAETQQYCRPDIASLIESSSGKAAEQLGRWAGEAIEQRLAHPSRRRRAKAITTTTCPACRRRSERIASVLSVLEKAPAKRLGRLRFCIPHLQLVLDRVSPQAAALILERERAMFDHLRAELAEFFRKADYRFKDEPRGSEQTAWMRAADVLAGCWLTDSL